MRPDRWGPWIIWAPIGGKDLPRDVRPGDRVQADLVIRPCWIGRTRTPSMLIGYTFVAVDLESWMLSPPEHPSRASHMVTRYRVWGGEGTQEGQACLELLTLPADADSPY